MFIVYLGFTWYSSSKPGTLKNVNDGRNRLCHTFIYFKEGDIWPRSGALLLVYNSFVIWVTDKLYFKEWIRPYSVSLHIQPQCGKIQTRKTLNTDTLHAGLVMGSTWCLRSTHFSLALHFIWKLFFFVTKQIKWPVSVRNTSPVWKRLKIKR